MPAFVVLCASDATSIAPPARPPRQLDEFGDRIEWRVTDADGLSAALPGADGLLLWDFFSSALETAWPAVDTLQWIHVAAAGVDTLLFPALRTSEVTVTNARGIFDRPIAEFVLASVLAHAKQLHVSRDLQRDHSWKHRETHGLAGSTALVIGTGGIGRETARLLSAVGMQVRGAGRTARTDDPDFGEVVDSGALASHVGDVDHLVMAAPLTERTHGLISTEVLTALPSHAHFVNVGRGRTVDEEALVAALQNGQLAGASLDVFATEPLPDDSPLWDLDQVAISPHLSGDVVGWRDRLADQFVTNLRRWLADEPLTNVVDKQRGYVPGHR